MSITKTRPEVLAPAGTLEKLKVAIDYGADAVYIGGQAYGLRSRAGNFTFEEMVSICYQFSRELEHSDPNLNEMERLLDEDEIFDFITKNIEGDCLLAVGDESLIKIHFHTNTPWKVVEYAASLGEIYDIVIENMERQEQGLQG